MNKFAATLWMLLACVFTSYAQADSARILDFQECIDIALKNNLDIRKSKLTQENAHTQLVQSQMSRLPSLSLSTTTGYNWGRSIDPTSNEYINQRIQTVNFSGSASMTLFNWFRLTNTIKQNRATYSSSEYSVTDIENDVTLNVLSYYLNVILNKELLNNATFTLKSSQEQLNRTKRLVATGAAPRTDELELVSQVATGEVDVIGAQNDLNTALLTLKQTLLLPASENIQLVIPNVESLTPEEIPVTIEEIYNIAVVQMPGIHSAEMKVRSAEFGVKVANAGYAPTLSLSGSAYSNYSDAYYDYNSITGTYDNVAFSDQLHRNLSQAVSMAFSIPIFSKYSVKANVQTAKVSLQQAEISVLEEKNALRQAIEQAYNDVYSASRVYGASLKQVDALEETFRSVENQYNLGAANFTDYQVANNNLFGAKSELIRAKFDYIFKMKILDFYQNKSITF